MTVLTQLTLCLNKKKKPLDLQIFSRIGKTMKNLQWIQNTNVNTCIIFLWCLRSWWRQNWFIYLHLVSCLLLKKVRGVTRALQMSTMDFFWKIVCNVNLKTLTFLTKKVLRCLTRHGLLYLDGLTLRILKEKIVGQIFRRLSALKLSK